MNTNKNLRNINKTNGSPLVFPPQDGYKINKITVYITFSMFCARLFYELGTRTLTIRRDIILLLCYWTIDVHVGSRLRCFLVFESVAWLPLPPYTAFGISFQKPIIVRSQKTPHIFRQHGRIGETARR